LNNNRITSLSLLSPKNIISLSCEIASPLLKLDYHYFEYLELEFDANIISVAPVYESTISTSLRLTAVMN